MKQIVLFVFLSVSILFGCSNSQETQSNRPVASADEKPKENIEKPVIMFFGNSITAGYGIDQSDAFSAIIQRKLDSLGYNYRVINAGLSGETTATGLSRVDWVLKTIPEIFVLELAGNDGLRGLPLGQTKENLLAIVDKVRAANPDVKILLAGMEVPPNMGPDYASEFRAMFPAVSEAKEVPLIPFILDKVGGEPSLNLPDGIHPTEEGHLIVAETVWKYLEPLLDSAHLN
ncbi:MAG: GDSL-type esterase/lipase family protein [bacterium]|nr:GDSL-type esterase/lipase family protein [bacterium]